MMVKTIKCIKIVHPLSEVKLYRILSGYFRFMGIFACENITGQEYGDDTDWEYEIRNGSEESEKILEQGFNDALDAIGKELSLDVLNVFKQIADIYIKKDLMRASYAIAYFADSGEKYIYGRMIEAKEKFHEALEALDILKSIDEEGNIKITSEGDIYLLAAIANCKRRINELYNIIWDAIESGKYNENDNNNEELQKIRNQLLSSHYFEYSEIKRDIEPIWKNAPDFYGAYAILGFAMELDDRTAMDSVAQMKKAIQLIGENKSYTSYLYYRIGRYCEVIRPNLPQKIEYYQLAYSVDNNNYRAIYKIALYKQKQEQDFKGAEELWQKLREVLEDRKELKSLQPVECAYIYKTYHNLGNLYIKWNRWEEGIKLLEEAVHVYENGKNGAGGFYQWMFKDDCVEETGANKIKEPREKSWEVYKRAAKRKLQIKNVYVDIIKAAAQSNSIKKYKKYSQKKEVFQIKEA